MGGRGATVRAGNERVLAARLADAKFFFDEDRKTRLESRLEKLKGVIFHQKLGTLYQKVGRVTALATKLADTLGDLDAVEQCRQAAKLCKADLVTSMVGEFPMLQGVMGREYALHDGEPKAVADAIAEHYRPRFAEDVIPESLAGKILSLADRLDTVAAFFSVGLVPSGSEDPFGTSPTEKNRSEEHTSELQSRPHLVCRLLLEKKKTRHLYDLTPRSAPV